MANHFNSQFRNSRQPVVLEVPKETYLEDTEVVGETLTLSADQQAYTKTYLNSPAVHLNVARSEAIKPKDIIRKANNFAASSVSSCLDNDEVYLELFIDVLNSFLADALQNKFNFLLAKLPLFLDRKELYYDLPNNFHTQSNLFVSKQCPFYEKFKRFTFQPFEAWSETTAYYTYTINEYQLYLSVPEVQLKRMCENVKDLELIKEGHLQFEYYYIPNMPTHINDPVSWIPNHSLIIQYLTGLMREKIFERNNRQYAFPEKQKLWESIMAFTTGQNNVNSNKRINKKFLTFSRY